MGQPGRISYAGAMTHRAWCLSLPFAALLLAVPAAGQAPGHYVLALSAQPAFCERKPDRPECETLAPSDPAVRLIALHGLWIQPRGTEYCALPDGMATPPADWAAYPDLGLDPALADALRAVMPGVGSHLDRHEWFKHGTCSHDTAEAYYRESVALMHQVWERPAVAALAARQGETLSRAEVEAILAPDFGAVRLTVECEDGMLAALLLQLTRRGEAPLDLDRDLRPGEIRFRDCGDRIVIDALD